MGPVAAQELPDKRPVPVHAIFDVFNVFNRVNFGAPETNVSSGSYGTISTAQPPRQFQLGVRLEF